MKGLVQRLDQVRQRSGQLARELHRRFGTPDNEPPISALNMSYNHIVLALELCDHYLNVWNSVQIPPDIYAAHRERLRQENGDRVVVVTKAMFILCMSVMEYSSRECAKRYQDVLSMDWNRRQYLSGLIGKSHAVGILDANKKNSWDAVIKMRNSLIHNNGIAEESLTVSFPAFEISMIAGNMISGKLPHFIEATSWTIEAYAEWCEEFLTRAIQR